MNDSKDFMDAEPICSGNPHVTSPPGLFPRHPPFVGMLKPAFISQRQQFTSLLQRKVEDQSETQI